MCRACAPSMRHENARDEPRWTGPVTQCTTPVPQSSRGVFAPGWGSVAHSLPRLVKVGDPLGIGSAPSLALCVFAEFFCGVAVLVGFFTRAASFVLVINFWVAVFVYGREAAWPQNELPLLYMICFAALIGTGSGPLALDRVFTRRFNEQGTSPLAP